MKPLSTDTNWVGEGNTEGRSKQRMLTREDKAYISGFLDGDGCIMFQLIRRKDYRYGYQVRGSIVFYQKTVHADHLRWLQMKLGGLGYVRNRNDGMTEYTIVGLSDVVPVLQRKPRNDEIK